MLKFLNWQPSLCASKQDIPSEASSEKVLKRYNELTTSMTHLVRETLNLKLFPKFSAHALSTVSVVEKKNLSESLSKTTLRSFFGKVA